jgi:hypothetical protein
MICISRKVNKKYLMLMLGIMDNYIDRMMITTQRGYIYICHMIKQD